MAIMTVSDCEREPLEKPGQTAPGDELRAARVRLGLTTRDVDLASRRIAAAEANSDYIVSHARLVQIESGGSTPSLYKLYSLAAIYGVPLAQLAALYLGPPGAQRPEVGQRPRPHLLSPPAGDGPTTIDFPSRRGFDDAQATVARLLEAWGDVPTRLLAGMSLREGCWGYIGLDDYTLYPLLRPGSLVRIDASTKTPPARRAASELDRPIYFVELREGYVCSWCEFHAGRLVCVPHPLSSVPIREFEYPREAEVVGRVTAVAALLLDRPDAPALATRRDA